MDSVNKYGSILSSSDDENENINIPLSQRLGISTDSQISGSKRFTSVRPRKAHTFSDSEESGKSSDEQNTRSPTNVAYSCSLPSNSSDSASNHVQLSFLKKDNGVDTVSSSISVCLESAEPMIDTKNERKKEQKEKNSAKREKALERMKERDKKKDEKKLAKALKDIEREKKRNAKPGECLKVMHLSVDNCITEIPNCEVLFNSLLDNELHYSVESNLVPSSIMWYRNVVDLQVVDNQAHREERKELENVLLLYISNESFVDMVCSFTQKKKGKTSLQPTLLEFLTNIKDLVPNMDITVVTVDLENHMRNQRISNLKRNNQGNTIFSKETKKQDIKNVSKNDVEESVIEVQLQAFINYKSVTNMEEFSSLLARFTKAIAEAPFKKEKRDQNKFSWYADADSSCPVKVAKDGTGMITLWQQQIQQFNNVGKETAQAIVAKYPSPRILMEAYRKCATQKEAEILLKDIVVRRDYGPLGEARRIGPELSYKIYLFFTSMDENVLLQR